MKEFLIYLGILFIIFIISDKKFDKGIFLCFLGIILICILSEISHYNATKDFCENYHKLRPSVVKLYSSGEISRNNFIELNEKLHNRYELYCTVNSPFYYREIW